MNDIKHLLNGDVAFFKATSQKELKFQYSKRIICDMKSRTYSYSELFWLNGQACGVCGKPFAEDDPKTEAKVSSATDKKSSAKISVPVCNKCLNSPADIPETPKTKAASSESQIIPGLKPVTERQCAICGESFLAKRRDAKYCSPKCRQRAHRAANTA